MKFKESGISDTLHRFWKKEHDWGWKKFMELSKLHDGFVIEDVLTIKAQVQVIRYLFSVVIWHPFSHCGLNRLGLDFGVASVIFGIESISLLCITMSASAL